MTTTTHFNKWLEYESEKRELQELGLSPEEYEMRINEIAERLDL